MSEAKPINLAFDDAVKLLPQGEQVHTFRQCGLALVGADWDREELLDAMSKSDVIQVTGPLAQRMGHGLAINSGGVLFIEAANYYSTPAIAAATGSPN